MGKMDQPLVTTGQPAPVSDGGLLSRSFLALLATQFLVALNDNMFRWLIVPIGKDLMSSPEKALALGGALFLLPFVLLAGPAGYLADRCSKRAVIVGCKVAEIVIMILGVLAILSGSPTWMLSVLFLMGAQSAIFSPAKYGSIPEIVRHDRISAANGWIGMTTMCAVIVGAVAGGYLYDWTTLHADELAPGQTTLPGQHQWWISATALIGVAVVGWVASLFMRRLSAANPQRAFPWNPAAETYRDLAGLFARRPLLLAALGSAFFWSLGLLTQLNIDKFARPELVEDQQFVGYLLAILTLGIGLGSVLAGLWSRNHVEEGLVPIGAAGITVALVLLTTVPAGNGQPFSGPYLWAGLWLLMLGLSAGLYDIPLLSFMQDKAPRETRGSILAAYNFLSFSGMLLTTGIFWILADKRMLDLNARPIFLISSLATAAVTVFIAWLIPLPTIRVIFSVLIRILYRIRVRGLENVPKAGGAILVANHVSWLDGLLLGYLCPRRIYLVADIGNLKAPFIRRIVRDGGVIQFSPDQRRSVITTVRTVREMLRQGCLIGIFAEGGISRTGQITGFSGGFLTMLKGTQAPVIPVNLHGLWGSILSFERGRFFKKWPRPPRLPISLDFGEPILEPADVQTVRSAVQRLATQASLRPEHQPLAPARQMLRACRRNRGQKRFADSTGQQLNGPELLSRALLLRRVLRRELEHEQQSAVGILLLPSVAGAIANATLALNRQVSVNLDPALEPERLTHRWSTAGVRRVLTSRPIRETLPDSLRPACLCLEDLEAKATAWDRLLAQLQARLVPVLLLDRILNLDRLEPDDVFTILFTESGKQFERGVRLSQRNIASNVAGCGDALQVYGGETLLAPLPFWRADGFTLTLWSSLLRSHRVMFDAGQGRDDQIGPLCRQSAATVLAATAELLAKWVEAVDPEHFRSLQLVMCDPCLDPALAAAFQSRFGVRPYAGYGATELSPVAAVNVPPGRIPDDRDTFREGTVGWTLAGVTARVVDPESGADQAVDTEGLLLIAGPNVMLGYAGPPEETERILRDGWFATGLRARIDEAGFLHLVDRPGCPTPSGDSA